MKRTRLVRERDQHKFDNALDGHIVKLQKSGYEILDIKFQHGFTSIPTPDDAWSGSSETISTSFAALIIAEDSGVKLKETE